MSTKPASTPQPAGEGRRLTPLPDPPKPPDAMQQLPHIARAILVLEDHFHRLPNVFVNGDGYLCYEASELPRAPRPDCVVAFGIAEPPESVAEANGYTISEIGKPPDFVLEVASASTGRRDYTVKRDIYAGYGVAEYWRFDHTGGRYHDAALAGDRLVNGVYEPIEVEAGPDGISRGYSVALGLELHWVSGRLRFYDPVAQEYLSDLTEAKAQRDNAVAQRDDAIAQRDAAEERIRQLEAELRFRQSES